MTADPTVTESPRRRWPFVAVVSIIFAVAGVVAMLTMDALSDRERHDLSDDDTRSAVMHAARNVVRSAGLTDVTGTFSFQPCSNLPGDDGEPPAESTDTPGAPYNGRVDMTFAIPAHKVAQSYLKDVAVLLGVAGWRTPILVPNSDRWMTVKDKVATVIDPEPGVPERGRAMVFGECRNWTDHHDDGTLDGIDVTDELW